MPGHSPAGLDPQAKWPTQSSQLHYERYTELADYTQRGMLFLRNSNELPAAEKHLCTKPTCQAYSASPCSLVENLKAFLAVLSRVRDINGTHRTKVPQH